MLRGDLNHPRLWEKALANNMDLFSIYMHSMAGVSDQFFKQYQTEKTIPSSYSIHMNAWQYMLQEALKDPENEKFVFLSESCLPLRPLRETYVELLKNEKTHMAYKKPWWGHTPQRDLPVPEKHRWGNHEWLILHRKHAEMIANDRATIQLAENTLDDMETYPSVFFSLNKILNDDHVINQVTTFVQWDYPGKNNRYPYELFDGDQADLALIAEGIQAKCYFIRKISKSFPIEYFERILGLD